MLASATRKALAARKVAAMRRILRKAAALLVVLYIGVSVVAASIPPTATAVHRLGTLRCDVSACDLYLSRGTTRALAVATDLGPASRAVCAGPASPPARVGCHLLVQAIALAHRRLTSLAQRNQCLRIRFVRDLTPLIGLSSDGGPWCRD